MLSSLISDDIILFFLQTNEVYHIKENIWL